MRYDRIHTHTRARIQTPTHISIHAQCASHTPTSFLPYRRTSSPSPGRSLQYHLYHVTGTVCRCHVIWMAVVTWFVDLSFSLNPRVMYTTEVSMFISTRCFHNQNEAYAVCEATYWHFYIPTLNIPKYKYNITYYIQY